MAVSVQKQFNFGRKFQTALVRVLFQHPGAALDVIEVIDPGQFDLAPHRWIIEKLKRYHGRHGVAPTITVLEHEVAKDSASKRILPSHRSAYLACVRRLSRVVSDRDYILDEAHAFVRYTRLADFVLGAADKLQRGETDWVLQQMDSIRSIGDRVEGDLGQDLLLDLKARHARRKKANASGVPTGLPIDRDMRQGGLAAGQLGVVLAPPGRGKTGVLCFMAGTAVLSGRSVLYVSVELDEDMIYERLEARLTGVPLFKIVKKQKTVKRKLTEAMRRAGGAQLRVKHYSTATLTVGGLRALLKRLQSISFYPDLLLLDYADDMDLTEFRGRDGKEDRDYGPLGSLYKALRGLAGDFHVPIWTASQTNRDGADKEVLSIKDFADSFRKAAVSDVVLAVAQNPNEVNTRTARLILAKNRNGPINLRGHLVRYDMRSLKIG